MNEKVSVIIVTYNAEKTLSVSINSVLKQSYPNIECLIIDGASKDSTLNIIASYGDKIRYLSEPDSGIYDAMNKGWQLAEGEWILYLGADDELVENGIESLMNLKLQKESDIIYGDTWLKFANGKLKRRGIQPLSSLKFRLCSSHQSFIMHKSVFQKLGGFNTKYKIYGDLDLIQRAYLNNLSFTSTPNIISIFYIGGISTDNIMAERERYLVLKSNKSYAYPFVYCFYCACIKILLKIKHRII